MKFVFLSGLLSDVWDDLREPTVAWQAVAILVSIAAGWLLALALRRLFAAKMSVPKALRFESASFLRVLVALFVLGFVFASKLILAHWQKVNVLRLAVPFLIAIVLMRFMFYMLHPMVERGGLAARALRVIEKLFPFLVWAWFILYVTGVWPEMLQGLDDVVVRVGSKKVSVLSMLQAAISVIVTLLLALWSSSLLEARLMRLEDVHTSFRVVLTRMARALLILIAILFSLSLVGIDLTVLSVFGGALGVGLGLGLQKIASNYVSGFIILLDRSLTLDDMIMVDKFYGRVTQINTRYTVLRGLDGIDSIIPNEMLVSSPVQNHSLMDREVWISTDVTVGYDTDIDTLFALLEQTAAGIDRVSSARPPLATLVKFGADGLELRLGFWISDPEKGTGKVLSDVNRAIWKVLKEQRIEVPFPQRVVRMVDERS